MTLDPLGSLLPHSPLASAKWVRDIVYYDGPILSEFRSEAGDPVLFSWCDRNDDANRWLALRVIERELIKFVMRKTDLHVLVRSPPDGFVYVIDIDPNGQHRRCSIIEPGQLPPEYMPDAGSVLPPTRASARRDTYAVFLDGTWDTDEISDFPTKYRQSYLAIHAYGSQSARTETPLATHQYPWKGGFSAVHFYKNLLSKAPKDVRPRLGAFVYASPGYIRWDLDTPTALALRDAVDMFGDNRENIRAIAHRAYAFIREYQLNAPREEVSSEIVPDLKEFFWRLAAALGSINGELLRKVHGENDFVNLKILLSMCTRMEFLHKLVARDMVEL